MGKNRGQETAPALSLAQCEIRRFHRGKPNSETVMTNLHKTTEYFLSLTWLETERLIQETILQHYEITNSLILARHRDTFHRALVYAFAALQPGG
nr:hypothetical protein 30 [bacterium]